MRTITIAAALALTTAGALGAQQTSSSTAGKRAHAHATWGPAPAVFPAGAQMSVIKGDPGKAGEFTVALRFPDGYQIAPHFHPTTEHVTVRRGTLLVGMGDTVNLDKAMVLKAGKSGAIKPNMHHYAAARGETEIRVRAMGPFALTYVNAADTPAAAAPTTPR